jgi:hypothetical protein
MLCFFCVSTAHAEFVEYYNYTIDEEGDTTLVIVASFDTLAMQLRAEIQQSPLGTAVETSDLTGKGGGYLTGEVTVSVTGDNGQSVSLTSQFVYLPFYGPAHAEIVDVDFNFPAVEQTGPVITIFLQEFIKVEGLVNTSVNTQTGETQTTADVSITTPLGSRKDLTFSESVTSSKEGVETKQSVALELESKDGTSTLQGKISITENAFGEKSGKLEGRAAVSDSGVAVGATLGIDVSTDTTTVTGRLFGLYNLGESTVFDFWLGGWLGGLTTGCESGIGLGHRLYSDLWGKVGASRNTTENSTFFHLQFYTKFWALTHSGSKTRPPVAMSESPPGLYFRGTSQSTFCCPDTSSCVEQTELTREVPASSCETFGMVYGCSFQPSDPNSLSETMSVSCQSTPGRRGKEKIRDIPKVEAREPMPTRDGSQGGRYLSTSPNPFNPETRITFETFAEEHVAVQIYNVSGRRVRALASRVFPSGRNHVTWDGRDDSGKPVAGGVYFIVLKGKEWHATGRAVLLK